MPRIFDSISQKLLDALRSTPAISQRADLCDWSSESGQICRVMVGMQRLPQDEIKALKMAAINTYRDVERGLKND